MRYSGAYRWSYPTSIIVIVYLLFVFFGSVNFVSSAFVLLFDVVVIVVLFEVGLGLCIGFQSFTLTKKFLFFFQILTYINFLN